MILFIKQVLIRFVCGSRCTERHITFNDFIEYQLPNETNDALYPENLAFISLKEMEKEKRLHIRGAS